MTRRPMNVDENSLAAAAKAVASDTPLGQMDRASEIAAKAITAYLSASLPADVQELVAEWQKAMEGVTPGPWRPSSFGFQVVSDFPEAAWQSVVELRTIARSTPHAENEMESQQTIAAWIARCSPSGVSALLDKLTTLSADLARTKLHLSAWEDSARIAVHRAEAAEAEITRLKAAQEVAETKLRRCQWYWPEDDTSSEYCQDSAQEVVEEAYGYQTTNGDVIAVARGGIVQVSYCASLPPAEDADSDEDFWVQEDTREAAKALIDAEIARRARATGGENAED